jgi:P27 family predicted phage terminase small subunit
MTGPRPVPDEQKALMGYPGKGGGAKSNAEIKASVAAGKTIGPIGDPFPDMAEPAKAKWYELSVSWSILLKATDRQALRIFCETWCDLMVAQTMTAMEGPVVPLKDGSAMRESIWANRVHKLRPLVNKMLTDFGATPSARTRVELVPQGPVKAESKFNGLVNSPTSSKVN